MPNSKPRNSPLRRTGRLHPAQGRDRIVGLGGPIMRRILLCAFAILAAGAVRAETVTGSARVLDGDTIEIGQTKVRLFGIDAPEGAQPCMKPGGHSYACGDEATNRVKAMTSGHPVECKGDQHDQY